MGVKVAVTRVAANTSTGNQTISTGDLGGLTPKAVLLIATRGVTDGSAADGAGWYIGASDGTNEWTQGYEDQHAQTNMDTAFEQDTTSNRILTIYDGTADDVVEATANFVSFQADGVTIDWTDAPASAFLITAIFFAGSDLSAHVGTVALGNTADALVAITSVGFEADVVFTTLLEGTSVVDATMAMGVIHNNRAGEVTQRTAAYSQDNGASTGRLAAVMREGNCIAKIIDSTFALDWMGTAQSFDSSGFDVQLGNARSPANHHLGWLALRFGSSPVVSSKVYTYSTPTGTGSHADTGPGFEPQFVLYLPTRTAVAGTIESDADGGVIGVVMADADEVYTQSIASEDASADSNSQSLSDDKLNLPTHTGTAGHEATFTSFGGSGVTWSYSSTDATARVWAALAIQISSDNVVLVIQDATHSHSAENVGLTQHNILAIADALHTQAAENLSLTQHNVLAISDASHAHSLDSLFLGVGLVIQDALHLHTLDEPVLTQHNILSIQEALHSHFAENLDLIQHHQLAIADALHGHTLENVTLTQHNLLAIQDALHAHSAESFALIQHNVLVIEDVLHTHELESLGLTQHHLLVIQEMLHSHNLDNVVLFIPSDITFGDGELIIVSRRQVIRVSRRAEITSSRRETIEVSKRSVIHG